MIAPLPSTETARLEALRRYEVLDSLPEQDFDDITLLAAHICGTPIALISLVDEDRQWFKSRVGVTQSETSRDIAFCAHGILQPDVFEVKDALADERFATNPLVTENPKIRFYAGAPLVTPDGHALGMLCVNDRVRRELSPDQKAALQALSRQVVAQLEMRRALTERKAAEQALLASEARNHAIVQTALDCIVIIDHAGRILEFNPAAEKVFGHVRDAVLGRELAEVIIPPSQRNRHRQGMARFLATGEAKVLGKRIEITAIRSDGTEFPVELSITRLGTDGQLTFAGFIRDITERKRAEAALEKAHQELMETSRRAGMAEVATGILHNVGNVLNSVNIASTHVADGLRKSKAANLSKVVAMLREHESDLGSFITTDVKGRQLPGYLAQLAEHLSIEQVAALKELAQLQKNIEHIKDIVAMQQTYAMVGGVKEMVNLINLVEDSLRMNGSAFHRHRVAIIREFEPVPAMNVEKHKILQILVNLLRNAMYACDESGRGDRRLTVRVAACDGHVRISVIDNGIGISPENLTRIFNHGFTTRKDGHGFGLHSGALAAREMGGSLTVSSNGLGQGACFTLELPGQIPEHAHE